MPNIRRMMMATAGAAGDNPNAYSWGSNGNGQLGHGNTTTLSSPVQIGGITWASIGAFGSSSCGVSNTGKLYSWGKNNYGQLGHGNTTYLSEPTQIGSLSTWSKVIPSKRTAWFIKTDGTLWGTGYNGQGGLGDGTTTVRSSPVQIGVATNWVTGAAGNDQPAFINSAGKLYTWGSGGSGSGGRGNTTNYSVPTQVGTLTDWRSVDAGGGPNILATKTDNTIWSWGSSGFGVLGNGTGSGNNLSSPAKIGSLTDWSANIACSLFGAFAVKTDGTLWAWGRNDHGELGQGNTTDLSSPVKIGALTNWSNVWAGFRSVIALKTDGTLWGIGENNYGQLGLGDTTLRSSPAQIGSETDWVGTNVKVGVAGHHFIVLRDL